MIEEKDAFVGYHLRMVEERLDRIEIGIQAAVRRLRSIDAKIDALGSEMTPAERTAVIAQLNADAAKIDDATATLTTGAASLDKET